MVALRAGKTGVTLRVSAVAPQISALSTTPVALILLFDKENRKVRTGI